MATDSTSEPKGGEPKSEPKSRLYRRGSDSTTGAAPGRPEVEREVLRALLHHVADPVTHAETIRLLASYRFSTPLHEMAFELLRSHRHVSPGTLREHLPPLLTNQGFPDENWEPLLEACTWTGRQLLRNVHALLMDSAKR